MWVSSVLTPTFILQKPLESVILRALSRGVKLAFYQNMYKTLDWKIAYKKSLHFSVAAKLLSSAVKLEFSMLEPSNDWAAWLPPIWWPHRFSEPQKINGQRGSHCSHLTPWPRVDLLLLPVFSLHECYATKRSHLLYSVTRRKKKKKHPVLRALKLVGLFQKLHDAQVYLSTSVPAMHFYSDGAPQSKLSRRVDVINCLDEYRSIGDSPV